jgi:hypothetical protein
MKKKLLFLCCLLSLSVVAQQQNKKKNTTTKSSGEIENTEIVIEKNRKIELPEADRNFEKISETIRKPEPQAQQYDFQDFTFRLPGVMPRFQVLPPASEKPQTGSGNYVKGGFGNYTTTYGELFLNNTKNSSLNYGFYGKHLASATGSVRKKESASGSQKAEIFGKYKNGDLQADVSLAYNRQAARFYGFTPSPLIDYDIDKLKHNYNLIDFKTSLKNRDLDSLLGYQLGFSIASTSDNFAARELGFGGKAGVDYIVSENISTALSADMFFTNRQDTKGTLNRNYLKIKPEVRFVKNKLSADLGLNIVSQNDTGSVLKSTNVYPSAHINYLVSRYLNLFAGISGDMERNTLRKFASENLWLSPNFVLQNTDKPLDVSGGIKASLPSGLSIALKVNFEKYKNLYFFTNTLADTSKFEVRYETTQSSVVHPQAEVSYQHKKFNLGIKTDFYNYQLTTLQEPFHRPKLSLTSSARYYFTDNLLFSVEFYYLGGLKAQNPADGKPASLKSIADFNIKAEYFILEKLSAFLELNNVLSQNYQRYLNYQVRGIQALAGVSYSF